MRRHVELGQCTGPSVGATAPVHSSTMMMYLFDDTAGWASRRSATSRLRRASHLRCGNAVPGGGVRGRPDGYVFCVVGVQFGVYLCVVVAVLCVLHARVCTFYYCASSSVGVVSHGVPICVVCSVGTDCVVQHARLLRALCGVFTRQATPRPCLLYTSPSPRDRG